MGMLSLIAFTSKFVKMKSLIGLAGMALIIGGIGLLFTKLSDSVKNADTALTAAKAIGIIVTALSVSALMLSKIGSATGNNKGIWVGLGVFAALAGIVGIFAGVSIALLPKIAKQLSKFMTELKPFVSGMKLIDRSMVERIKILGEAMSAFAGAGAKFAVADFFTIGGASTAFGAFVEFIKEIVPVITEAALVASAFDIDFTNLDGIIKAVSGLAEAAALVPGNTIALIGSKWGGGLLVNTNGLSGFTKFVTSVIPIIQEFAIEIKDAKIDTDAIKVINDLFKAIGLLAEAADKAPGIDIAAGFATFKGGVAGGAYVSVPDLYAFTSYVKEIFGALKEFLPGISGTVPTIPIEFITGIFDCVKKLGEAAGEAPTISAGIGFAKFGALWSIFGGGTWTDMDSFRKYLVGDDKNIGAIDAVKNFINGIDYKMFDDIKSEKISAIMGGISNVITAISALAKAAEAAPKTNIGLGVAFTKLTKGLGIGVGGYKSTTDLDKFKEYLLGNGTETGVIDAVKEFIDGIDPSIFDGIKSDKITAIMDGISSVITAVSALAKAADSAPKTVDTGGLGGLFSKLGIGFGVGEYHSSTDLEEFRTWLIGADGKGGMISALTGFIDIFDDTATLDAIKKIGSNTEGFNAVISAVTTLATLANSAPKQIDAKGGLGGIFGKLVGGLGLGVGGGYGEYHSVTDLENFTKWITEVTPIIKGFVVDTSDITIPDGSALENVLTAIDTLATAANNVKPKTEGWATGFAYIAGIPVGVFGTGSSETDYEGFISLIETLGTSDGPLVKLVTAVNSLTFDGSVDSAASEKLTCLIDAVDALAAASTNIPNYTEFETAFTLWSSYKEAPDFAGFADWITSMTGEDGTGGIVKLITDANDNLPGEGELDPSKISNLCYVVNELAKAADVIPDTSVWGEIFGGVTDFSGFTEFVNTVGTDIVSFAETIKNSTIEDVDLSKILSMADVLKTIAEVGNLLGDGGYVDVSVLGIKDAENEKTPIDYVVDAVIAAKEKLAELDEGDLAALEVSANAINAFSQVLTTVAGKWSSLSYYTQDSTVADDFKTFVTDLATALSEFTTKIEGVNLDRLSIASTAVSLIAETLTKLAALEYGAINTALFKSKLDELATAISEFSVDFETTTVDDAINTISTIATDLSTALSKDFSGADGFKKALETLGGISLDNFVKAMTDHTKIAEIGPSMMADVVTSLTEATSSATNAFASIGTALTTSIASGITSGASTVATTCTTVVLSAASTIGSYGSLFSLAGFNMGVGFANGISSSAWYVKLVAAALAKAALNKVKSVLDENSPSKEAYKVGAFFGEGFVGGIDEYTTASAKAGESIATAAKTGLSGAISKVKDLIENGVDNQPTIRPVLDLSEVEAGAHGISDMFGVNPSVALMSNVGSINSMMNNRQNGGNNDIVSAIKDLGRKIGKTGGDTYNVNGVTYDDGSNINTAVKAIIREARVERRR